MSSSQPHHHRHHPHSLSINSLSSIIEPTTPPNHSLSSNNSTNINSLQFHSHQQPLHHQPRTPATSTTASSNSSSSTANTSYLHNRSLSSNGSFAKFGTHPNIGKSVLWDSSNKLNHNLNLPNFNIDNEVISTPLIIPSSNQGSVSSTTSPPSSQVSSFQKLSLDTTNYNSSTSNNRNTTATNKIKDDERKVQGTVAGGKTSNEDYRIDTTIDNKENVLRKPYTDVVVGVGSETGVNVIGDFASNSSASSPPSSLNYAIKAAPSPAIAPPKIDKEYLTSINKVPLTQLRSEILKLAKDQYGCRFLQKKIDENLVSSYQVRASNFEVIFDQVYPYMCELIVDPFGNYLVQKMIPYCSEENLDLSLEILQYNLCQISVNQHGTRALQKIIDSLNSPSQLNLLIKGLKPYIIDLIRDLNGNHVIQKILNKYDPPDCQFIYDSIIDDLYTVATHKHGCCVLQKCLNHVTPQQLDQFSKAILRFDNFKMLINDQFGNYVLQYLISINSIEVNYGMFHNFLQSGLVNLCNSKFSSNVVEKFMKNCYNNETQDKAFTNLKFELIYNILTGGLNILVNDPYGNYVIQTMLDILINPQSGHLSMSKISMLLPKNEPIEQESAQNLQITIIKYWFQNCKIASSFGKRIQSKINTILNNNGSASSSAMVNKRNSQMNANGEFVVNEVQYSMRPPNHQTFIPQSQPQSQSQSQPQEYPYQYEQQQTRQHYFRNNLAPMMNQNASAMSVDHVHQLENNLRKRNYSVPADFYSTNPMNNTATYVTHEMSNVYVPTGNSNGMNSRSASNPSNNSSYGSSVPPQAYLSGEGVVSQATLRGYIPEDTGNRTLQQYQQYPLPVNGGVFYPVGNPTPPPPPQQQQQQQQQIPQVQQQVQMPPPFYPHNGGSGHQHSLSVGSSGQPELYTSHHPFTGYYTTNPKSVATPPSMQEVQNFSPGSGGTQAHQLNPNIASNHQVQSMTPMLNRGPHHTHNASWSSSSSNQNGVAFGTPSW
ncbi:MPT5 [Candida theae]|uniref:MPT5 n=1 Tax=Candida theae TaxID=1198502 RepID=A0AAD5FWQ2_9ASCO|nr:MPT5 [Candida theae]KAI5949153.1 MPT5 [Candida theae]